MHKSRLPILDKLNGWRPTDAPKGKKGEKKEGVKEGRKEGFLSRRGRALRLFGQKGEKG